MIVNLRKKANKLANNLKEVTARNHRIAAKKNLKVAKKVILREAKNLKV